MTEVILYLPTGPGRAQWLAICNAHCAQRSWRIVAVVSVLSDALVLLHDRPRLKLVTGTAAMLTDSDSIEVVADAKRPVPASQRRPQRLYAPEQRPARPA